MNARLPLGLLPLALAAACAGTPDGAGPSVAAETAPSKLAAARLDGDKMICTRERTIGTNRPQKVCMTKADRAALAEQARNDTLRRSGGLDDGRAGGSAGNSSPNAGEAVAPPGT